MDSGEDFIAKAFERRMAPLLRLADNAQALALASRDMAERFADGGRLLVFGSGTGVTDAAHVAVEFVHPVIVGKPALPAFALSGDAATMSSLAERWGLREVYAHQVQTLGRSCDIALGLCGGMSLSSAAGLRAAHECGLLTIAFTDATSSCDADHRLAIASDDPLVVKEGHVCAYHLLWELVHVFLEAVSVGPVGTSTARSGVEQLYPFVFGEERGDESLLLAAAESARQKLNEIVTLRREAGLTHDAGLAGCAADMAAAVAAGGTLYVFGNGGSSTDAQAVAHAFANLSPGLGKDVGPVPAVCLAGDSALLTALANDVGFEVTFSRQIQAFARPGDIAVGISTSGGSVNVLSALEEARRRGLLTVGLAGYGGGQMVQLAGLDHVFAVASTSVHRIQEVQTTLYHVLCEATAAALQASR